MKLNRLNYNLMLSPRAKDGWRACFSKFTTVYCNAKTNPFIAGSPMHSDHCVNWEEEHCCFYLEGYYLVFLYLLRL